MIAINHKLEKGCNIKLIDLASMEHKYNGFIDEGFLFGITNIIQILNGLVESTKESMIEWYL